jgi:RNA polymerase sigma-70 factor, ECF subfamily
MALGWNVTMSSAEKLELGALAVEPAFASRSEGLRANSLTMESSELVVFAEAFDQHAEAVWRTLKRLGVAEHSLEDATQDVFVVAYQRWRTFQAYSSRKTWLLGIAVKIAKKHRHRQRRVAERPGLERDAAQQSTCLHAGATPYETAASREAGLQLQRLLDELDCVARSLVVLVYLEELTVGEAARSLGLSQRQAFYQLDKARRALASAVRRRHLRPSNRTADGGCTPNPFDDGDQR